MALKNWLSIWMWQTNCQTLLFIFNKIPIENHYFNCYGRPQTFTTNPNPVLFSKFSCSQNRPKEHIGPCVDKSLEMNNCVHNLTELYCFHNERKLLSFVYAYVIHLKVYTQHLLIRNAVKTRLHMCQFWW